MTADSLLSAENIAAETRISAPRELRPNKLAAEIMFHSILGVDVSPF